jgi:hypothetical protein
VWADVTDHLRAPGFFTTVAAASIVGSQFALLRGDDRTATALWVLALVLWVAFTYTIFTALTIKQRKPRLDRGINGSWLLGPTVVNTTILPRNGSLVSSSGSATNPSRPLARDPSIPSTVYPGAVAQIESLTLITSPCWKLHFDLKQSRAAMTSRGGDLTF